MACVFAGPGGSMRSVEAGAGCSTSLFLNLHALAKGRVLTFALAISVLLVLVFCNPDVRAQNEGGLWGEPETLAPPRSVIDVMILYTGAAREAYGEAAIRERLVLSIAYLNEAFNRSGVNAKCRLIHAEEVTWHAETPEAADELDWLASDGTVAELRDRVGADLVSLLVREGRPTGGMAQLPGSFSVFNGSPFVFTHECGHNLGCNHDRANAGYAATSSGCNFGYVFKPSGTAITYGDIMSYDACQFQEFSNPNRFFRGAATGIPEGHLDEAGYSDAADNVSVLNRTVVYAAGTRMPQVALLEAPQLIAAGTQFKFQVSGPVTGFCTIERSADRRSWAVLTNSWLDGTVIEVSDSAVAPAQYYRARLGDRWLGAVLGYVKKELPVGFSMIANPLDGVNNTVESILAAVPEGTQLFKWIEGRQAWQCNSFNFGAWEDPAMTLHPGEGVVVRNPGGAPLSIAFAGEVLPAFHNRVPGQLSVRSSATPDSGPLSSVLNYIPFGAGGQVFRMVNGVYAAYTWDGSSWSPEEPVIEVGEAFWCRNPLNPLTWIRLGDDALWGL